MNIVRQDAWTEFPELIGHTCNELMGVGDSHDQGYDIFYMSLDNSTYRFFMDVDILFCRPAEKDPDDDIGDGKRYIDLFEALGVQAPLVISKIEFKSGVLMMSFENDRIIFFSDEEEMTLVQRC